MDKKNIKVIISGGGTGGHIYPAVSIAQEIKMHFPDADILFVGAKGKMEMEKVPKAGFKIEGLWISGLQRKITFSNILFPIKLLASIIKSHQILNRFKPDLAIGVGGFASGPLLYAAAQKNIPTLIHEQNSYAGITNKWLAPKVNTICVAYDKMEKYFPTSKIVKTGNPVRNDILDLTGKREKAYHFFNLDPNKKTILVIGGSLGARTLNESIKSQLDSIQNQPIQILWQTGKLYFEDLKHIQSDTVKVFEFIYEMDLAYAVSDIVISRAGASSVSELGIAQKPVILVPSPNVAEDHQTKNAMALVEKNAAILIKDTEAKNILLLEALKLLQDVNLQHTLSKNIVPFGIRDARERIYKEIEKLIS